MTIKTGLQPDDLEVFWDEIAPHEHVVEFYEDDRGFLDSLEGFVMAGLKAGEGVVVVGTTDHLESLEERFKARGVPLNIARSRDQYFPLNAEETLSKFMVDGMPDQNLFERTVIEIIARAGRKGQRVRVFGEMVFLLWSQGHAAATVRLENFWHQLCRTQAFSLYCAYPKLAFPQEAAASINQICAAHSKVVTRGNAGYAALEPSAASMPSRLSA